MKNQVSGESGKRKEIVVQSNDLIEAFYDSDLTATEHKIIRFAASKIKDNPELFPKVEFSVGEFLKAGGLNGRNYHGKIEKMGDSLIKKSIKVKKDNNFGWFTWVSTMTYIDGVISLTFNLDIKDLLLKLEGQFTKYSYHYIGDMRSGYSIRLYELLKQYAIIGKRRINVDILKKMLGVEDKYKGYGQFKQRVLNQAKKELDKKGTLTFEFEEIKQGRQVREIVFFIQVHERQLTLDELLSDGETDSFVKEVRQLLEIYQLEVNDEVIRTWKDYSLSLIKESLEETKDQKINHPAAFLTKVFQNKKEAYQSKLNSIQSEDDKIKEKIVQFINRYRSKEVTPDWFLKDKFNSFLKKEYSPSEIDKLWEDNKEYILNSCQLWKQK